MTDRTAAATAPPCLRDDDDAHKNFHLAVLSLLWSFSSISRVRPTCSKRLGQWYFTMDHLVAVFCLLTFHACDTGDGGIRGRNCARRSPLVLPAPQALPCD